MFPSTTLEEFSKMTPAKREQVKKLVITGASDLNINLPINLKVLHMEYVSFSVFPILPEGLIDLECTYYRGLLNLPSVLPHGLLRLNVKNSNLKVLPQLPDSLLELKCSMNDITLPSVLPEGLLKLNCSNCDLKTLPQLPSRLLRLNCSQNDIAEYPRLPESLLEFDCSGNTSMTVLPILPPRLITLKCYNRKVRIEMDQLPHGLRFIKCHTESEGKFIGLIDTPTGGALSKADKSCDDCSEHDKFKVYIDVCSYAIGYENGYKEGYESCCGESYE